jgi:hypothetical protein
MKRSLLLGLGLGCVFVLAGCGSDAPRREVGPPSQALLASIGTAQALQHESDTYAERGDVDQAMSSAHRVLDIPFPTGAPEREDVRLDAYGRMAELELDRDALTAAEAHVSAGLAEVTHESYFGARLHLLLGRIHEARAAARREASDEDGARAESQLALDELEQSIAINRVVLGLSAPVGAAP